MTSPNRRPRSGFGKSFGAGFDCYRCHNRRPIGRDSPGAIANGIRLATTTPPENPRFSPYYASPAGDRTGNCSGMSTCSVGSEVGYRRRVLIVLIATGVITTCNSAVDSVLKQVGRGDRVLGAISETSNGKGSMAARRSRLLARPGARGRFVLQIRPAGSSEPRRFCSWPSSIRGLRPCKLDARRLAAGCHDPAERPPSNRPEGSLPRLKY